MPVPTSPVRLVLLGKGKPLRAREGRFQYTFPRPYSLPRDWKRNFVVRRNVFGKKEQYVDSCTVGEYTARAILLPTDSDDTCTANPEGPTGRSRTHSGSGIL
jgi:hypothetical protein